MKGKAALELFLRERLPAEIAAQPIVAYGSVCQEILRVSGEIQRT